MATQLGGGAGVGLAEGIGAFTKGANDMYNADVLQQYRDKTLNLQQQGQDLAAQAGQRQQQQFDLEMQQQRRLDQPLAVDAVKARFKVPEAADYATKYATDMGYIQNDPNGNAFITRRDAATVLKDLSAPEHLSQIAGLTTTHYSNQVKDIDNQIAAASENPGAVDLKPLLLQRQEAQSTLEKVQALDPAIQAMLKQQKEQWVNQAPGSQERNLVTGEVMRGPVTTDKTEVWGEPYKGPGGAVLQKSSHGQVRSVLSREKEGGGVDQDAKDFRKDRASLDGLYKSRASIEKGFDPITGAVIPQTNIDTAKRTIQGQINDLEGYMQTSYPDHWKTYRKPSLGGGPALPAPKTLDPVTAKSILSEAGGDKIKARQIAKDRGYSF